jgi:hypothetical protein
MDTLFELGFYRFQSYFKPSYQKVGTLFGLEKIPKAPHYHQTLFNKKRAKFNIIN